MNMLKIKYGKSPHVIYWCCCNFGGSALLFGVKEVESRTHTPILVASGQNLEVYGLCATNTRPLEELLNSGERGALGWETHDGYAFMAKTNDTVLHSQAQRRGALASGSVSTNPQTFPYNESNIAPGVYRITGRTSSYPTDPVNLIYSGLPVERETIEEVEGKLVCVNNIPRNLLRALNRGLTQLGIAH
jgi:hypothetical protein